MHPILILSTIPHYISVYFFENRTYNDNITHSVIYNLYYSIIIVSSSLSVIWHLLSEPSTGIIMTLDYIFAYLWTCIEIIISILYFDLGTVKSIILMNSIVGSVYLFNTILDSNSINKHFIHYIYSHSIWHVLSFTKCIMASYILNDKLVIT